MLSKAMVLKKFTEFFRPKTSTRITNGLSRRPLPLSLKRPSMIIVRPFKLLFLCSFVKGNKTAGTHLNIQARSCLNHGISFEPLLH